MVQAEAKALRDEREADRKVVKELVTKDSNSFGIDDVTFTGAIEVDAFHIRPSQGDSASDMQVSKVEFGVKADLTNELTAQTTILYEEDQTDLGIDIATLTYAPHETGLSFSIGQDYLPFGNYHTNMVNEPLTQTIGETRETAFVVSYNYEYFTGDAFLFNGNQDINAKNVLRNYGGRLVFANDSLKLGTGYTSNIADSDALEDKNYGFSLGAKAPAARSYFAEYRYGSIQLSAEQIAVTGPLAVDGNGSKPKANHYEASVELGDYLVSVSRQTTREALFLGLPETRTALGVSTDAFEGLNIGLEFARSKDYPIAEGGSGDTTEQAILRVAAEF